MPGRRCGLASSVTRLYLWQQPFLNHDVAGLLTRFPANLAAAFLAASFSYYFVETPILNLRKRLVSAAKLR